MPRDNYHLTAKFLGNVDEEGVSDIEDAASVAAGAINGFKVRLGSLGAFPSARRARVIWIGIDDPTGGFASVGISN